MPSDLTELEMMTIFVHSYTDTYPNVHKLYTCALCFEASTATVENTFSCVTRLLTLFRSSMSHERKSNFLLVAFEKDITKTVTDNALIEKFTSKSRKLLLMLG